MRLSSAKERWRKARPTLVMVILFAAFNVMALSLATRFLGETALPVSIILSSASVLISGFIVGRL